jgi:hypothetical protein
MKRPEGLYSSYVRWESAVAAATTAVTSAAKATTAETSAEAAAREPSADRHSTA